MPPFFAGDCARVDCLGALDGAVRSGIRAARLLAKTMTTRGKQASPE
jgi:monoamine oxidase